MINHETVERQRGDNDWLWVAEVEMLSLVRVRTYIHRKRDQGRDRVKIVYTTVSALEALTEVEDE